MAQVDVVGFSHAQQLLKISTLKFLLQLRAGLDLIEQCAHWSTGGLLRSLNFVPNPPELHTVFGMGIERIGLSHVQIVLAGDRKEIAEIG